jgi:hypothetical protein
MADTPAALATIWDRPSTSTLKRPSPCLIVLLFIGQNGFPPADCSAQMSETLDVSAESRSAVALQ